MEEGKALLFRFSIMSPQEDYCTSQLRTTIFQHMATETLFIVAWLGGAAVTGPLRCWEGKCLRKKNAFPFFKKRGGEGKNGTNRSSKKVGLGVGVFHGRANNVPCTGISVENVSQHDR